MVNLYNAQGYLHTVAETDTRQPLWKAHAANALGQVTLAQTGDGTLTTRQYTPETGRIENINVMRSNVTLMDQHYTFDAIGKLTERSDTVNNVIQSLCYDNMNRLVSARTSGDSDFTYDALGNITSKLHVGDYQYNQTNNAGPHAVTAANGLTYHYDENGNLTEARNAGNDIVRQVQYSAFNKPTRIDNEANWTEITYGPDQTRVKREDNSGRVTYYFGDLYEEVIDGGITQRIHTVGDFALHIEKFGLETGEYNEYLHRDHLGSIVTRSTDRDSLIDQQAFGPWGQRLLIAWDGVEAGTGFEAPSLRGYTGHEHLDNVGLIHMNGRVYDPELGRFLSPDPFVQAPYNTQNYNRYSYVLNNPLSLTDPTGYFYGEADMMHAILMDSTMGNERQGIANFVMSHFPDGKTFRHPNGQLTRAERKLVEKLKTEVLSEEWLQNNENQDKTNLQDVDAKVVDDRNLPDARKAEIRENIKKLASKTMEGKYSSEKEAAVALSSNKELLEYARELGYEFWAIIDRKTFSIKEVNTGFMSNRAWGVYEGTFRGGDSIWHTHPSGADIHLGDLGSVADYGGKWIFASGKRLTGFDLWTTGYTSSNAMRADWGRGNITLHIYEHGSWKTEPYKF